MRQAYVFLFIEDLVFGGLTDFFASLSESYSRFLPLRLRARCGMTNKKGSRALTNAHSALKNLRRAAFV